METTKVEPKQEKVISPAETFSKEYKNAVDA